MPLTSDVSKSLKAIKILKIELTSKKGALQTELRKAAGKVSKNVIGRFRREFPNRGRGPDVINAIKASGFEVFRDKTGDITVAMFDENKLDLLTKLKPTIVTGQSYSLWRLLSAGFGAKGSGRKDRGHIGERKTQPYPLFVFAQTSALKGRFPPFPELLALEGHGVFVVRHSGFKGREWFLKNGRLFKQDSFVLLEGVERGLFKANQRAGLQ